MSKKNYVLVYLTFLLFHEFFLIFGTMIHSKHKIIVAKYKDLELEEFFPLRYRSVDVARAVNQKKRKKKSLVCT